MCTHMHDIRARYYILPRRAINLCGRQLIPSHTHTHTNDGIVYAKYSHASTHNPSRHTHIMRYIL